MGNISDADNATFQGPDFEPLTDMTAEQRIQLYCDAIKAQIDEYEEKFKDAPETATFEDLPTFQLSREFRFISIPEKEFALKHREHYEAQARAKLAEHKVDEEHAPELLEQLFEGRTELEPAEIPKDILLFGRRASEISDEEMEAAIDPAYEEHLSSAWGF